MEAQIDFHNIENPDLRQRVKNLMDELVQICPSDASVRARFHYIQDKFLAEINVASQYAYMYAIDQAGAMGDVLDQIKSKIVSQIVDWRIHRFA